MPQAFEINKKVSLFHFRNKVGMTGFEPATFCTQNKRATKLRYIPIKILRQNYVLCYIFLVSIASHF